MPDKIAVNITPIDKIKPYERNARKHTPEQIEQIAASIKEFGWTFPILIDGKGQIIAGHGRLEAAKLLGIDEVPTITKADLSEEQQRAYVLADNQLPMNADWNKDLLKFELDDLHASGFDPSLIGFGPTELANFMFDGERETKGGEGGEVNYVIQYSIIFDSEEQQERFFAFMRVVKGMYPDGETFAEQLDAYIKDHHDG